MVIPTPTSSDPFRDRQRAVAAPTPTFVNTDGRRSGQPGRASYAEVRSGVLE